MTPNPISVKLENKISDVQLLFAAYNIRHIPVIKNDELVGIISKLDVDKVASLDLNKTNGHDVFSVHDLPVSQIMTSHVESIQIDESIKKAAKLLSHGTFHSLPVLEGKKLKGIVTSTDIINYALDLL